MSRRKKGNPVHGWLILDKPEGLTSTRAVAVIKRLYDAQKAGHAGTLDPLATGILPIALGEATKTVSFAVDGAKAYRFTVRWGVETNTDDSEGTPVRTSDRVPTLPEIEAVLPRFVGEISQVPPAFSAIKIEGERAYDLARDGEAVELAPRTVVIDRLSVVDMPDGAMMVFAAEGGKSTYVRSLARDMGRAIGCYGHVIALRRTRVGSFTEEDAVVLGELERAAEDGHDIMPALLPCEAALDDVLAINVSSADASRLARGQSILLRGRDAPIVTGAAYALSKGRIVAIGELEKGELRPTRVFNLGG